MNDRNAMLAADSTEEIEAGRRLFAGEWQFAAAAGSIASLPPMRGMEIAFAGRSNVGKSSLINALCARKALARPSRTPGRTQEPVFFHNPTKLVLVEVPGYGYAAAKSKIAAWTALIHAFLARAQRAWPASISWSMPATASSRPMKGPRWARPGRSELSARAHQVETRSRGRACQPPACNPNSLVQASGRPSGPAGDLCAQRCRHGRAARRHRAAPRRARAGVRQTASPVVRNQAGGITR